MQALFILGCWVSLVTLGGVAPFVMALAYVWVDLFRPQDVAPALGQLLPFSATTAMLTIGAYLVLERRNPPRLGLLKCAQQCGLPDGRATVRHLRIRHNCLCSPAFPLRSGSSTRSG